MTPTLAQNPPPSDLLAPAPFSEPPLFPRRTLPTHAPGWQTQLWQRLVVAVMRGAAAGVQSLSPVAAVQFGDMLGRLAHRVARRQRRRCLANLHLAYRDELTAAERDAHARQVFAHFGRGVVDFLRGPARSASELARLVACDGWEHVEAGLRRGKGLLLVTGHFGNWELLGRWLAMVKNVPLTVVAKEPDSPALAAYLRRMRENGGFTVLSKGESARGLLRALRRGEAILILADQNSGDVFAPFFGVPAGTAAGPTSLALHSGAALIPIYCAALPDNTFRVTCFPALDTRDGAESAGTGDRRADVLRLTTELNQTLESVVRAHPDQWLWLHNRWKSAFEEGNRAAAWDNGMQDQGREFRAARERWET